MPNIVKNTTIIGPFDLLAPHSCRGCGLIGKPLCDCCKKNIINNHQNICPVCHQLNPTGKCSNCQSLPPTFIVGHRDDLIGTLVHDFKYDSLRALALPLAEIIHHILPTTDNSIIVPLPTIGRHIRERGFSHTDLLAKKLAKLHPHSTALPLLTRTKNTIQVGSSRKTRIANASSTYGLAPKAKIDPSAAYILLDDVWTTGASMQSAYAVLKQAGASKIILALLARSD